MPVPAAIKGDVEFFRAFARLEQTLKASSVFLRRGTTPRACRYPTAEPNWNKFENVPAIQNILNANPLDPEIQYLRDDPPWRQVVDGDGNLAYEAPPRIEKTADLLRAVRTVRNNLFHGEKTTRGREPYDPRRNEKLIASSMAVLREILKRCPEIARGFCTYGR